MTGAQTRPYGNATVTSAGTCGFHLNYNQTLSTSPAVSGVSITPSTQTIERPLTAQELAEIVPLHPVTLLRWAREGRIPHRRLGPRRVVFIPSQIQTWLASGSNLYPETVSCAASTHESEAA